MTEDMERDDLEDMEVSEPEFGQTQREQGSVVVDVGRGGQTERVQVGSEFVPTMERLASQYNYGGYFRVWLNGNEIINPSDSPSVIEEGMRLAITPYDKVG